MIEKAKVIKFDLRLQHFARLEQNNHSAWRDKVGISWQSLASGVTVVGRSWRFHPLVVDSHNIVVKIITLRD